MTTSFLATLARAALAAAVLLFTHAAPAQTLYYLHADHLNTPRLLTDQNQAVIWRWDPTEPFGNSVAAGSMGRDGFVVTVPLRYPGQYFDKETNLNYNYFRDYDPAIGRYVQSDPIGLQGGINLYAYVGGNPISKTDPLGLQSFALPGGVDTSAVAQGMACAFNPAACNPSGPLVEPQPTSCEGCKNFLQTCYATAGGSGLGLGQVVKSVVTAVVPQARMTATIAGAVTGGVAGQNLSLQCQKAFNECMDKVCKVCR